MDNINYRGIPTSLFLNGPKLGIVTDPQSQTGVIGVATFTGIATASFPNATDGVNDGSIEINWYFDGSKIANDEGTQNNTSNASIVGFSSATGTGSTITINGLTADDSNKEVYFTADYIPSAYQTTSPVTAGTARSTGNAFNELLQSGIATITVSPIIEITSQPTGQLVSVEDDATYSIAAQKTPGGDAVNYQWQLNGNDLSDGTTTRTVTGGGEGSIIISVDGQTTDIKFSEVSSYDSFVTGRLYTLTADRDITTKLFVSGAGGGRSNDRKVVGGRAGSAEGTFTFLKGQAYKLKLGGVGVNAGGGGYFGGGDGGGGHGAGGGGGGLTGLFIDSITQENAIIIAGGGGGGSNDPARGGAGGGVIGEGGSNPGRGGVGGTQTAGGAGGGNGTPGSALQGGPGAAGGGGGYFGGGGGQSVNGCCADGAGGGGSGFLHPTLITDGAMKLGGGVDHGESQTEHGTFRIEFTAASKEVSTTVTGSNTDTLTINAEATANGTIRCKCTATDVQQSPVFSNTVSYVVVEPRSLIEIETYNYNDATATFSEFDLANGDLTIDYASYTGNAVCLYSGDKDIDVEIEMYGGKASTSSRPGGQGGYSKIRFTMERNVEHVLTGLFSAVNAPFLYRKATLIACVGAGGQGAGNRGGNGGGIGIAGAPSGSADGGRAVKAGAGNLVARFGSKFDGAALTGGLVGTDTQADGRDGGDSIPCTKGVYWREQGKAPCDDVGTVKFRTPNGTEISNTATIARGYKSGYNAIQTAGAGENAQSGDGGCGYVGGDGGDDGGGGGGGTGYTDGSVTVIDTQQGGSDRAANIIIRIADPNTIDPSTVLQDVIFTVGRSAAFSNVITFAKESGNGPDRIVFGPNSGTVTASMGAGAIYNLESTTINGAPGGSLRLSGAQLQLEDSSDGDFNDLTVTPTTQSNVGNLNGGQFTSTTRFQF